jgi:hypothetical protein
MEGLPDVTQPRPATVNVPRQRVHGAADDQADPEAKSTIVLPVNPSSVRVGRRIVVAWLDVLRERYDVNTVLLLVTELLVNAVDRAAAPFRLSMWAADGRLHIETRDESTAALAIGPLTIGEADDENRRLRMVAALAERWGIDLFVLEGQQAARVVWFEYPATSRPAPNVVTLPS